MAGFCYWAVVVICAAEIFIAAAAFHRRLLRFLVFLGVGVVHGLVPLLHPAYHITAVWQPSEDAIALAPQLTLMGVAAMATAWHLADFRHRASMSRRLDVDRGPVAEPNRLEGVRHAMPVHVVPPELT